MLSTFQKREIIPPKFVPPCSLAAACPFHAPPPGGGGRYAPDVTVSAASDRGTPSANACPERHHITALRLEEPRRSGRPTPRSMRAPSTPPARSRSIRSAACADAAGLFVEPRNTAVPSRHRVPRSHQRRFEQGVGIYMTSLLLAPGLSRVLLPDLRSRSEAGPQAPLRKNPPPARSTSAPTSQPSVRGAPKYRSQLWLQQANCRLGPAADTLAALSRFRRRTGAARSSCHSATGSTIRTPVVRVQTAVSADRRSRTRCRRLQPPTNPEFCGTVFVATARLSAPRQQFPPRRALGYTPAISTVYG